MAPSSRSIFIWNAGLVKERTGSPVIKVTPVTVKRCMRRSQGPKGLILAKVTGKLDIKRASRWHPNASQPDHPERVVDHSPRSDAAHFGDRGGSVVRGHDRPADLRAGRSTRDHDADHRSVRAVALVGAPGA
jgi:hypothetical protein